MKKIISKLKRTKKEGNLNPNLVSLRALYKSQLMMKKRLNDKEHEIFYNGILKGIELSAERQGIDPKELKK